MHAASSVQGSLDFAFGVFHVDERNACLREWLQGDAPLFCCSPVPPGEWPDDWMQEFGIQIKEAGALPAIIEPHRGPWEMWMKDGNFSVRAVASMPEKASAVIYPKSENCVGVRQLWQWRLARAREVWFLEADGWKQCHLPALFKHRLISKAVRRLLGPVAGWLSLETPLARTQRMLRASHRLGYSGPPEVYHRELLTSVGKLRPAWINADKPQSAAQSEASCRSSVVQYIGSLGPGGAERQFCYSAIGLMRRGLKVRVRTGQPLEKEQNHYTPLLERAGLSPHPAGSEKLSPRHVNELPWHLRPPFPAILRHNVIALAADLAADLPDVLHCWLDQTNLIGGVAGLLTGVRTIILGLRNLNPTHFSNLDTPYNQSWYAILAQSHRVHFVANSHAAAASYAAWIGIPLERVAVIRNGFDSSHFPESTAETRLAARRSFGLRHEDHVVSGIFRLSEEKLPEVFLEVIRRVRLRVPNLRVLLAGIGSLHERVAQVLQSESMSDYVNLLGRRTDVGSILLASDANLLTSRAEGCPNVALEAQCLGVPMIATAAPGTSEAIEHGKTGFLGPVGDADALADHLTRVLTDEALRRELSAAGPAFVAKRFGLDRMIEETLSLYKRAGQADRDNSCSNAAA
jgi:glycosyltransferase involved in cell wall biosynthesis